MLDMALTPRQQRGLELAATKKITRTGKVWVVPSQSGHSPYVVTPEHGGYSCTCPDFELYGRPCKHAYAVEFVIKRETAPDGTVTETRAVRVTYAQNWPAYNAAQVSEKETFCALLRDLVASVPQPEQKRGRPPLALADKLFAAGLKVYSTVSGRRFMTDLRHAAAAGHIAHVPHYNSVFNLFEDPAITDILRDLVTRSALPLASVETEFAVDSTGLGINRFYRHFTAKYGRELVSQDWVKLHATVGVKTNVITAVEVTDKDTHDGAAAARHGRIDRPKLHRQRSQRGQGLLHQEKPDVP